MNRSARLFAFLITLTVGGISRGEESRYVVFAYRESGPVRAQFGRACGGSIRVEMAFPCPVVPGEEVLPLPDDDGMPAGRVFVAVDPERYRAAKALVEAGPAARAAAGRQGLDTRDSEARTLERVARYLLGECPDADRVSGRSLVIRAKVQPAPVRAVRTPRDPVDGAPVATGPEVDPGLADALSKRRRMAEEELQQLLATRAADRPRGLAEAEADRSADDARFRQFRAGLDAEAQAALEGSRARVVGASDLKAQVRQQHAWMKARLESKLQESHQAIEQSWAKFDAEFAESMAKGDQAAVYLAALLGVPPEFAAAAAAFTGASPEVAAQLAQSRAARGESPVAAEVPVSSAESTSPARFGPSVDALIARGAPSLGVGPLRQPDASPPGPTSRGPSRPKASVAWKSLTTEELVREFEFVATKVNALDEAEQASTVQGRRLADYRDAIGDELQRRGVVGSPAPLPKAGSPLALAGKMVRAEKKGSTAGEALIGVGEAVTDFAVGTFKLTTGLLGASWGEETVDDTWKGVKQLPDQVKDTIDNWDTLPPREQAHRATTAILMLRGAYKLGNAGYNKVAPKTGGPAKLGPAATIPDEAGTLPERAKAAKGKAKIMDEAGAFPERGIFGITDATTYIVRAGPAGSYGDFLFGSLAEAQAYAKQLAKLGEATIRNQSALPRVWRGGRAGNPVDNINIFEVPPSTPFIQGVVAPQLEGALPGVPKIYPGGGPQVVIGKGTKLKPVGSFPVK